MQEGKGYRVLTGSRVTIMNGDDSDTDAKTYGALTNGEGKFTIAPLPPGKYSVTVDRIGFVPPVNLPPGTTTVSIEAGDKKEDVNLKLTPTGTVTGRILGVDGEPMANAEVRAEGSRDTRQTNTDEQGRYRLGGLHPGKYRIRSKPQQQFFANEIRTDGSREVHYAATYYPDSTARATSRTIDVPPAAQLSGIDIQLVSTPVVSVSGKVIDMPAGKMRTAIHVIPEGEMNFGEGPQNIVKADGSFTVSPVDPGKYTLVAVTFGQGQRPVQSAPLEVDVAGANIEHLELRMMPPFEVTGQVHFDDERIRFPEAPQALPGMPKDFPLPAAVPRQIRLQSATQVMGNQGMSAEIAIDDSFTWKRISPGRYNVALSWGPGYVRSVRVGSTETEGDVLDLSNGGGGPVVITVSSLTCEVSGTVTDGSGPAANAQVMLLSESGRHQYDRTASTKSDGTYRISGIPPGKYKLAAADDEFPFNPMQPAEALEDNRDVAESIELSPGDKLTKDLKRK